MSEDLSKIGQNFQILFIAEFFMYPPRVEIWKPQDSILIVIRITWIRNPVWENFYITYATGYFNGNTTFSFAKSFLWSFFHSIFLEKYLSILVMIHPFTLFHSENSKKAHSILDMGAKKRSESSQVLFSVYWWLWWLH